MSSTPFSPSIPTSEPILRYRRLAGGDGVGHTLTEGVTRWMPGSTTGYSELEDEARRLGLLDPTPDVVSRK
jgi:hypothetical protein